MGGPIRVAVVKYPDRKNLVLRWTDPATGRTCTRSAKTNTRRGAERTAAALEKALVEGLYTATGQISWEKFKDRYLDEHGATLAAKSCKSIGSTFTMLDRLMQPAKLNNLTADAISRFAQRLRQEGRTEATVGRHLRTLRAMLAWAVDVGLLAKVPVMPGVRRQEAAKAHSGAMVGEQFDRLLAAVPKVVGDAQAEAWRFYLRGLWETGLRLGESLELTWDNPERPWVVDLDGARPLLAIPAGYQKAGRDTTTPLTPAAVALLRTVPHDQRRGRVFRVQGTPERIGQIVRDIGEAARVVVGTTRDGQPVYAGAHTLRRSFGSRWALRVVPVVLKTLMRHSAIATTLTYYVHLDAKAIGDAVWAADAGSGTKIGNSPAVPATECPAVVDATLEEARC